MSTRAPAVGIIIRTRNESRWLREVLTRLSKQTYQDFETIIVDSGSTDETLSIAKEFQTTIVHLPEGSFTYPYAINQGVEASSATLYYLILSGHSVPIGNTWLESAITTINTHSDAMGVYGPLKAMPDATFSDKLFHTGAHFIKKLEANGRKRIVVKKYISGVLGFTNALIRKDLYDKHPVDERYAGGGEDAEWIKYWLARDYTVILDMEFAVHHSHYLGPIGWFHQFRHWLTVLKGPSSFARLPFRRDGAHKE